MFAMTWKVQRISPQRPPRGWHGSSNLQPTGVPSFENVVLERHDTLPKTTSCWWKDQWTGEPGFVTSTTSQAPRLDLKIKMSTPMVCKWGSWQIAIFRIQGWSFTCGLSERNYFLSQHFDLNLGAIISSTLGWIMELLMSFIFVLDLHLWLVWYVKVACRQIDKWWRKKSSNVTCVWTCVPWRIYGLHLVHKCEMMAPIQIRICGHARLYMNNLTHWDAEIDFTSVCMQQSWYWIRIHTFGFLCRFELECKYKTVVWIWIAATVSLQGACQQNLMLCTDFSGCYSVMSTADVRYSCTQQSSQMIRNSLRRRKSCKKQARSTLLKRLKCIDVHRRYSFSRSDDIRTSVLEPNLK